MPSEQEVSETIIRKKQKNNHCYMCKIKKLDELVINANESLDNGLLSDQT